MGSGGGPTGHPAGIKPDLTLSYKNLTVSVTANLLEVAIETESGVVGHQFSMVNGSHVGGSGQPES